MTAPARRRRRVLFVGHEASRTGAPIMLLHLLRWLRENTDIDFDLVLRAGGALVEDYGKVGTVFLMDEARGLGPLRRVTDPLRNLLRVPDPRSPRGLRSIFGRRDIGLVYSNTVTNGGACHWFSTLNCPVICHVHEVEMILRAIGTSRWREIEQGTTKYVAVAEATHANLVRCGVAPEKITVVPGFVPVDHPAGLDPRRRASFRREHGIPEDAFLVGGCGTLDWQKGPDLLLHVANALARQPTSRSLQFAWVGGTAGDPGFLHLARDIARSDRAAGFSLIPGIPDPTSYFHALDVFALTSRDDPLPLVALEAGSLGLPVVCFAGNAELLDDDCGVTVPYLDLECFARSIRELADDAPLRAKLGGRLAEKIRARHDVSVGAPRIAEIIGSFLGAGR